MPPFSSGALWFHGRSGWHENDLAGGGVRGHRAGARLRYGGPVTHEQTGERSCHSLSTDHSTEPQPSPLWQISQHCSLHLQGPESDQEIWIWINIELLTLRRWQRLKSNFMFYPNVLVGLISATELCSESQSKQRLQGCRCFVFNKGWQCGTKMGNHI